MKSEACHFAFGHEFTAMSTLKTVRFSQVVEKCGNPEPYTLWQAPEKDRTFQAALRENRVMTVHEKAVGSSADFGEVGYAKGAPGELLVFEKSLKAFAGKRVVGIKYDLLKDAPPVKRKTAKEEKPPNPKARRKPEPLKIVQFQREKEARPVMREQARPAPTMDQMKSGIRKALDALAEDRPVAAYKVLSRLV